MPPKATYADNLGLIAVERRKRDEQRKKYLPEAMEAGISEQGLLRFAAALRRMGIEEPYKPLKLGSSLDEYLNTKKEDPHFEANKAVIDEMGGRIANGEEVSYMSIAIFLRKRLSKGERGWHLGQQGMVIGTICYYYNTRIFEYAEGQENSRTFIGRPWSR